MTVSLTVATKSPGIQLSRFSSLQGSNPWDVTVAVGLSVGSLLLHHHSDEARTWPGNGHTQSILWSETIKNYIFVVYLKRYGNAHKRMLEVNIYMRFIIKWEK